MRSNNLYVALQYFIRNACLLTLVTVTPVLAQPAAQQWPAPGKSIKVVVPFPAGSGSDALARMIGQKVTEQTGAPVVIENKPGAGTMLGAQFAMGLGDLS